MEHRKSLFKRISESKALWATGGVFFVVGIGLCWGSYRIPAKLPLVAETSRDLGLAFCISVIVGVLIEIGVAAQMFEDGLNSIMDETVCKEVWNEIRVHMLSQRVIRRDFHITMSISKNGEDYVSKTTLGYNVKSRHGAFEHHVEHELDSHRNLPDPTARRFTDIVVDNKPILADGKPAPDVKNPVTEDGLRAKFDVKFEGRRLDKSVWVTFWELVHPRDVINWWMSNATVHLTITVYTPNDIVADVRVHHPDEKQLVPNSPTKGTWEFEGVMLPGQGFEIRLQPNNLASA